MVSDNIQLKVNTGTISIPIFNENDRKIGMLEFIPTDTDIIKRYREVTEYFKGVKLSENMSEEDIIKLSDDIKSQFDFLLNYSVSEPLFSVCSPLTVIKDADKTFYFESILKGIGDVITQVYEDRMKDRLKETESFIEEAIARDSGQD